MRQADTPRALRKVAEGTPTAVSLGILASCATSPWYPRPAPPTGRASCFSRLTPLRCHGRPVYPLADRGAWRTFGIRADGIRRVRSVTKCVGGRGDASSSKPELAAKPELVRSLAARVAAYSAEVMLFNALISNSLTDDETYETLLTVPGVGQKTTSTLVDVSIFPD